MLLQEVVKIIEGTVLTGEGLLDRQVSTCFASDMMSQVLAHSKPNTLLCTGLTNMQVIRTADMTELSCIVFVDGKCPVQEVLEAAEDDDLPMLSTSLNLKEVYELLKQAGLQEC